MLEALLDREICKKPAIPNGDVQDDPLQNDETNKNFFRVLEESDNPGRDLQGINSESTAKSNANEATVNTSAS